MAFEGKRVVVMGLGRFGGGVGVTRFLCQRGADVLVTDRGSAEGLADSVAKIQDLIDAGQVTLRLGEHNASDFTTCDMVVANPAVKPGNRFVRSAQAAGIAVTSEIRLLVEHLPNRLRTIGVTGSAGKSTVTAMIGHVLEKVFSAETESTPSRQDAKTPRGTRKVWVGGNIGGSLLEHLDEIGPEDWVVLELSSFMLEGLRDQPDAPGYAEGEFRGWSPHIAVVTNISENHLDWHGSMADYVKAKHVIVDHQSESDGDAVFGGTGTALTFEPPHGNHWLEDNQQIFLTSPEHNLLIPGEHNQINARLCSLAVQAAIGGEEWDTWVALADFPGLPHRLQFVAERGGVKYYNDSKCTTPEAAILAIDALTEAPPDAAAPTNLLGELPGVHLILGGYDKGSDLKPLAGLARDKCKAIYTLGDTGEAIAQAAADAPPGAGPAVDPGAAVVRCGTLDRAMAEIKQRVVPGDVVVLSPACASWDQFTNYQQRGERFIELVGA